MPPRRDRSKPVVNIELDLSFSAPEEVLGIIARDDERIEISGQTLRLKVRYDNPSDGVAELRQFADRVRKATRTSERV